MPANYHLKRKLKELMPYIRGKKVLDIGCIGENHNLNSPDWLHGRMETIADYCLGIDIQNDKVSELQARGYHIVYGDAQDFHMGPGPLFDTVFAGELIEHLPNPGKFLECVKEYLKPEGYLIITTPNPFSIYRWLKLFFGNPTASSDHKCWFDITTLTNLLKFYGFKIASYKLLPVNTIRSFKSDLQRSKARRETLGITAGLLIDNLFPGWLGKRSIFVVCERC